MGEWQHFHIVGLIITLLGYFLSQFIIKKYPKLSSGLILWSILIILFFLSIFNVEMNSYWLGGKYLTFLLGPSVIALGVSFYENYNQLKFQLKPFMISVLAGGVCGIISVVLLLIFLKTPEDIIISLAPKSITSPIAIEVSNNMGGLPEVTAGIVIFTGILGSVAGPAFLAWIGNKNASAQGAAIGVSAHGIGTAQAYRESQISGVFSGLAMCFNGCISAMLLPYLVEWLL